MKMPSFQTALTSVIGAIAGVLIYQSFLVDTSGARFAPKPDQPCFGEPLAVDYPYEGGMLDPHACAVQCEDGVQRYIVYTNEKATQCQEVPGCLDWGEDQGVTCIP